MLCAPRTSGAFPGVDILASWYEIQTGIFHHPAGRTDVAALRHYFNAGAGTLRFCGGFGTYDRHRRSADAVPTQRDRQFDV